MDIKSFALGPVGTNCYIVTNDNNESIVIDPGHDDKRFLDYIISNKINITKILLTHGHFDHIAGVDMIRDYSLAKVYINEKDNEMLVNPSYNGSSSLMGRGITVKEADEFVSDGDIIPFGEENIEVIETPGHSKGGVCYKIGDAIFVGDTIFYRSIGRTDLYGGSITELENSIRTKLYSLNKNYTLFTGHGEATSIDDEKRMNGFFRQ